MPALSTALLALFLPAAATAASGASAPSVDGGAGGGKTFRTEAPPRMDPVFGDMASLREAIDDFLLLHAETEKVRDELSAAVHATLAQLGSVGARAAKSCPPEVLPLYARTSDAGRRFLSLGRRLAARSREIARAEQLGEIVGLTPDYRMKAKKAGELYRARLRDYREMRAAVYEQLGAELRHAGCKLPVAGGPAVPGPSKDGGAADRPTADPANPSDWVLDPAEEEQAGRGGGAAGGRSGAGPAAAATASSGGGPAIWIKIDNTRCAQASRLTLDGVAIGEIAGQKNVPVRTRAGPHELCLLPASDKRACGAPGTIRRAYLYDGWTLAVRCAR
jgi:hypothetical protein